MISACCDVVTRLLIYAMICSHCGLAVTVVDMQSLWSCMSPFVCTNQDNLSDIKDMWLSTVIVIVCTRQKSMEKVSLIKNNTLLNFMSE